MTAPRVMQTRGGPLSLAALRRLADVLASDQLLPLRRRRPADSAQPTREEGYARRSGGRLDTAGEPLRPKPALLFELNGCRY